MPINDRLSGTRQDTFIVRATLNNVSIGVWDKKTGGAYDSDDIKYYPGGMLPPIMLGGKKTTDNITLQRNYDRIDDHDKISTLLNAVGSGVVSISQRPMDPEGHEWPGKSVTWSGILKRVMVPDVDSESTTASLVEIEVTINAAPTLG
jgi:hypothetical protein